ncbi:MAG TPA: hypothetical protein VMJ10_14220, partial [Kofleriaceae bacterium]|nr:hypothetical protein [Kofleriaceae bacterium]
KIDRATAIDLDGAGNAVVAAVMDVDQGAREDFALLRVAGDGTLDTTFGSAGIARLSAPTNDFASFVSVGSDGYIVVGGACSQQICLARVDGTGALDPTFGASGIAQLSVGATFQRVTAAAQDATGRWVLAGQAVQASGESDALVVRATGAGALDTAFAATGYQIVATGHDAVAQAVVIEPDGHVLVAGRAHDGERWTSLLARFGDDGSPDTAFASNGWRTQDVAPGSHDVAALVTTASAVALVATVDGMAFTEPLGSAPGYALGQIALPLALPYAPVTGGVDRTLVDGQLFASSLDMPFTGNTVAISGHIAPPRGTPTAVFLRANELQFATGAILSADGQDGQAPLGAMPGAGGEGGSGGGTGGNPHAGAAGIGGSFGQSGGSFDGGTAGHGWAGTYAGARLWGTGGAGGVGAGCCPPIVPAGRGSNGAGGGGGGMWDDMYTPGGGGGGGLVVMVANEIDGSGTITAHGGNGLADPNGGRSGGGGGGVVWIATRAYDGQLQVDISGGGTTVDEPGRPGTARIFQIEPDGSLVEHAFTDTW